MHFSPPLKPPLFLRWLAPWFWDDRTLFAFVPLHVVVGLSHSSKPDGRRVFEPYSPPDSLPLLLIPFSPRSPLCEKKRQSRLYFSAMTSNKGTVRPYFCAAESSNNFAHFLVAYYACKSVFSVTGVSLFFCWGEFWSTCFSVYLDGTEQTDWPAGYRVRERGRSARTQEIFCSWTMTPPTPPARMDGRADLVTEMPRNLLLLCVRINSWPNNIKLGLFVFVFVGLFVLYLVAYIGIQMLKCVDAEPLHATKRNPAAGGQRGQKSLISLTFQAWRCEPSARGELEQHLFTAAGSIYTQRRKKEWYKLNCVHHGAINWIYNSSQKYDDVHRPDTFPAK